MMKRLLLVIPHMNGEAFNHDLFNPVREDGGKEYPEYFVGNLEIGGATSFVIYKRMDLPQLPGAFYGCIFSENLVPYSYLASLPHFVAIKDDEELRKFTKEATSSTLDNELLKEGVMIYYFRFSDAACGQVKYYKGFEDNYPPSEFCCFLSQSERDNVAFRMQNDMPIADEDFMKSSFTGEQIRHALKSNKSFVDDDNYWSMVMDIIDRLKEIKQSETSKDNGSKQ